METNLQNKPDFRTWKWTPFITSVLYFVLVYCKSCLFIQILDISFFLEYVMRIFSNRDFVGINLKLCDKDYKGRYSTSIFIFLIFLFLFLCFSPTFQFHDRLKLKANNSPVFQAPSREPLTQCNEELSGSLVK